MVSGEAPKGREERENRLGHGGLMGVVQEMRKGLNWSVLDTFERGLGTGLGTGQSRWKFGVLIQAGHSNLILGEAVYMA